MSEFEFLSVLVSIIFGLGLTHILRGSVSQLFRSQALDLRLAYAGFFVVVLVLNWWVFFSWRKNEIWSFELFLALVLWAISHYVVAITLYRPDDAESDSRFQLHLFLLAFVVAGLLDILQTAREGLFAAARLTPQGGRSRPAAAPRSLRRLRRLRVEPKGSHRASAPLIIKTAPCRGRLNYWRRGRDYSPLRGSPLKGAAHGLRPLRVPSAGYAGFGSNPRVLIEPPHP